MNMLAVSDETVLRIPAPIVQMIVVVLIPIITGLLTKYNLSSAVKGIMTLFFSTVTAFISSWVVDGGDAIFTAHVLYNAAVNFVIAVAMYFGIYKGAGLTSSVPNGKLGANTGIGPSTKTD
jgi:hypothetical protein